MEFSIEFVSRTAPISSALYLIVLVEFKELKTQLQELLDKGFILPSVLPLGVLILFVKKNDWFIHLCINYPQLNEVTIDEKRRQNVICTIVERRKKELLLYVSPSIWHFNANCDW